MALLYAVSRMDEAKLKSAQIGASGVLLIQYRLLKAGIESAPMTTDAGIDLVAFVPARKRTFSIQVKTCLRPKPGGGKGRPALDWWLRANSPADLVALVDLSSDMAWVFRQREFEQAAQQRAGGKLHFYFYADGGSRHQAASFDRFKLESRIAQLF